MKKLLLLIFAITTVVFSDAQPGLAGKALKKVMTLKMPLTVDDLYPGTRGACVVWHPVFKKYYAAMAGNSNYPLATFDETGKRISNDTQTCTQDTRGLWYNPATKEIQGNTFDTVGWFKLTQDKKGIVTGSEIFMKGMNQPGAQCVAAYRHVGKELLFLSGGEVYLYDIENASSTISISIHWSEKKPTDEMEHEKDDLVTPENYNFTTVVYTGIKNAELGFLNATEKQIEFYDYATGYLTRTMKLPDDASAEITFNFAYANGIYWLFDMETRTWTGYK